MPAYYFISTAEVSLYFSKEKDMKTLLIYNGFYNKWYLDEYLATKATDTKCTGHEIQKDKFTFYSKVRANFGICFASDYYLTFHNSTANNRKIRIPTSKLMAIIHPTTYPRGSRLCKASKTTYKAIRKRLFYY